MEVLAIENSFWILSDVIVIFNCGLCQPPLWGFQSIKRLDTLNYEENLLEGNTSRQEEFKAILNIITNYLEIL